MRMRAGLVALCAAVFGYAAGVGTGAWAEDDDHDDGDDEAVVELEDVEDVLEAMEALAPGLVTPAKALEAVGAKAGGVPVELALGSESRDGKLVAVWEVGMLDGSKLSEWYVDARSGDVFAGEVEDLGERGAKLAERAGAAKTSLGGAAATVGSTMAGALVGVELESEDGELGWEALIVHDGRLQEVFVGGASGKVSIDADDDDHDVDDDDEHGEHEHDDD